MNCMWENVVFSHEFAFGCMWSMMCLPPVVAGDYMVNFTYMIFVNHIIHLIILCLNYHVN